MEATSSSERALLLQVAEGSVHGFERLVRINERRIFSLAFHLTGSLEDAEEVLGEVFSRLWKEREQISIDRPIEPKLVGYTIEASASILEVRGYCPLNLTVEKVQDQVSDESEEPFPSRLGRAIQKLPFEYRKVFVLHDVLGIEISGTSEILELAETDSRNRLARARLMIRRAFERDRVTLRANNNLVAYEQSGQQPDALL